MLAFIDDAYTTEDLSKEIVDENGEKKIKQDSRVVMKLDPRLSPIKVAILPLSKKEPLQNAARDIWKTLNKKWMCEYDESGSVGKRYRRQDEIGTPYCVTIDFESVEEKNEDGTDNKNFNTVTVRDRDSMDQVRIKLEDINEYFVSKFN
jgi:glycyl-tRNA synthetase